MGTHTQLVDIKSKLNHKIKLPDEALFIFCNFIFQFLLWVWKQQIACNLEMKSMRMMTVRYLAVINFILIRRI